MCLRVLLHTRKADSRGGEGICVCACVLRVCNLYFYVRICLQVGLDGEQIGRLEGLRLTDSSGAPSEDDAKDEIPDE